MEKPDWNERYSRQTILPTVGRTGQEKLSKSSVWLIGEGSILEAALTALASSGLSEIQVSGGPDFEASAWKDRFADSTVSAVPPDPVPFPTGSLVMILTEDDHLRRRLSRELRTKGIPALFGWNAGSGIGLFFPRPAVSGEKCPCFECFEILNPKAFNAGIPAAKRFLGASAAGEALLWILSGKTEIENQVWIQSLDSGLSFRHPVAASPKCPARLMERGAAVTP